MATSILEQVVAGKAPDIQRLTVEQYHSMREAGILDDGEPIELLDGLLVRKDRANAGDGPMVHGKRHSAVIRKLQRFVQKIETLGFTLQTQLPIQLSPKNEPEPDGTVLKGSAEKYDDCVPTASDVVLVIEVADSSLAFDRTTKQQIYSKASIPHYWIVNLQDDVLEAYSKPDAKFGGYKTRREFSPKASIMAELSRNKKIEIPVRDLIP